MKNWIKAVLIVAIPLLVLGGPAGAQLMKNYFASPGSGRDNTLNIGGAADVLSGATLTIKSGGLLDVDGTIDIDGTFTAADLDVSGTLDADTLDVDGAADFAQTVNVDGVLTATTGNFTGTLNADILNVDGQTDFMGAVSMNTNLYGTTIIAIYLDVSGTLDADTLDVNGPADFAKSLTAHKGVTISDANTLGNVPYVAKIDTTQVIAGATPVDGSTLVLTSFPAGTAVEFWCSGVTAGATEDKTVSLLMGGTVVATVNTGDIATDWVVTGQIIELTDAANQKIMLTMQVADMTEAGLVGADYEADTVDVSGGITLTVQVDSNATGNTITKEVCTWKVLPY